MHAIFNLPRFARTVAWVAFCAALVTAVASGAEEAPNEFVITSAQPGGLYRPLASLICQLVNQEAAAHGYRCEAVSSEGAVDNVAKLRKGSAAFGLMQSDIEHQAKSGVGRFAGDPPFAALRSVLAAHGEALTVLVPSGSDIRAFGDLRGHRLGIALSGAGSHTMFYESLKAAGWSPETFEALIELSFDDEVMALCKGEIDAAVMTLGHPNSYAERAIRECDARIIPVEGRAVDAALAKNSAYRVLEIPGGLYPNHAKNIVSFGPVALLMARSDVPDQVVEAVTAAVLDHIEALHALSPAFQHLDGQSMYPEAASAPIHPGALDAFASRLLAPVE